MFDFVIISTRYKKGTVEIYPKFVIKNDSKDLMIRGGDFYAAWIEDEQRWTTSEQDVFRVIDAAIEQKKTELNSVKGDDVVAYYLWDADSGMIDRWHKYCQKQLRDNFHMLDEKIIFANDPINKEDYASKRLNYALKEGDTHAWDKLVSTLYSPEERHKIEWAIGSIVTGDSKTLQKFMVFYGSGGTGKSTIINIINKLFDGYCEVFDSKALGSNNNSFALEAFKTNPLVATEHDGDLSKIEDNTKINSLVSHETMTVNEKFRSTYSNSFKCFLIIGTNKPVRITDGKSGLLRRLIDVHPTGNLIPQDEYDQLVHDIDFELGAIAYHCKYVYLKNPKYYSHYVPNLMMSATNPFYNFMLDSYFTFESSEYTSLRSAWDMYKSYCEEARVSFPYSKMLFKEELKNYFKEFKEKAELPDGTKIRGLYSGFLTDKFQEFAPPVDLNEEPKTGKLIEFNYTESLFDKVCANALAQYALDSEKPGKKWVDVTTKLYMLDTSKLHYVRLPINHIVIDFDIPDENGNKSFERNLEAASKWPATYAELSKSGQGIHLHYIYTGDPTLLSRLYGDHVEIKVFTGNASLRRKLTKCNNLPIATITSGLPLKRGGVSTLDKNVIENEQHLRAMIKKNLRKEIHGATKPSVDFIYALLEKAYNSGINYDVTDMSNAVLAFASSSTNQAAVCIDLFNKMHFKSKEVSTPVSFEEDKIIFFDCEVFPNLLLINWKIEGEGKPIVRMINPQPDEVQRLFRYKLVGFNNRKYDNHILYARANGYTNEEIYHLSQKIINAKKADNNNVFFGEAYNLSYADIYDFSAKKQSLKKFEIELGIHHQELGLPWDKPVPEELWPKVAEYCDNDVIATEAVWNARKADFIGREILSKLSGLTVNDTNNQHSARIIMGKDRNPQGQFNYRDLSKPVPVSEYSNYRERFGSDYIFRLFDAEGQPLYETYDPAKTYPDDVSILPFWPKYTFEDGVSHYSAITKIGEGGAVYSETGMYVLVALLDIASQHPHSIIAERLFGQTYTKRFEDLVEARVAIKHEDRNSLSKLLDGKLLPFFDEALKPDGGFALDDLAQAIKIVINSVYGLTSASFPNAFRDPRNVDNIVAKRGALFMLGLKEQVIKRGFKVAHIKTDSIKIPDATPEIIKWVQDYGKEYGYTFEHEATYDRMCLVNKAVYIARYDELGIRNKKGKHANEWTATGTQFQVPYVFKTLVGDPKDPITFDDMCETFSVTSALYLDMNENLPDVSLVEKLYDKLCKKTPEAVRDDALYEQEKQYLDAIEKGHNYKFIGKVGQFCPVVGGAGGGRLMRFADGKYYAATGSTGYRWLESETIRNSGNTEIIDRSFYNKLVDEAIDAISKYGSYEWFMHGPTSEAFIHIVPEGEESIPYTATA